MATTTTPAANATGNDMGTTATPKPTGAVFETRVIVEDWVATDPVLIQSCQCQSLKDFFSQVQASIPLAKRTTVLGGKLYAPVFILQETGEASRELRQRRFLLCNFGNNFGFLRWRARCVDLPSVECLKVEVRLRTGRCATLEYSAELEDLEDDRSRDDELRTYNTRYGTYKAEPIIHTNEYDWPIHPKDSEEIDDEDVQKVDKDSAPSTCDWFPERKAYAEDNMMPDSTEDDTITYSTETKPPFKDPDLQKEWESWLDEYWAAATYYDKGLPIIKHGETGYNGLPPRFPDWQYFLRGQQRLAEQMRGPDQKEHIRLFRLRGCIP